MKESLREKEYQNYSRESPRNGYTRKTPSTQSYSRSRPYGRDSITTNTGNTDPLQKLKDIAGYDNTSRSQSVAIFNPETIQSENEGKYF